MYTILIVDDEKLELEAFTESVPWASMGIRVIGTAKNGREALELTQRLNPDIVLTDVRMPIMDGLEFAKRAKQFNKHLKIVFLSGHDEFQYIKTALAVEASGYLLKPIDMEELTLLMDKVKVKCEEAKLIAQSEEMAKDKQLRLLLTENSPEHRNHLAAGLHQLDRGAFPLQGPYRAAYLTVSYCGNAGAAGEASEPVSEPIQSSVRDALARSLRALGYNGRCLDWEHGTFTALFQSDQEDEAMWDRLQLLLADDFPIRLTIGLSSTGARLENAYTLFREAQLASDHAFYWGLGSLLVADRLRTPVTEEIEVEDTRAHLCRLIGHQQSEETETEVARFFRELRDRCIHRHLVRTAAVRLVSGVLQHFGTAMKELSIPAMNSEWEIMNNCASMAEIEEHVRHVCHRLIMALSEKDKDRHQHIVRQIRSIIETSYQKPITVEDIAREVYLSPNYIRTIFKEKTGQTILEVITQHRMEQASLLLADKSLKIHEIAGRVGYENVSYFCSIFQKTTGLTPNSYRKQIC
ncbi:two-component system response regulator YesN [Paenibacillus phyllosphaerae]|uniref:Two-component system response regulator YesN n=1 Tax=Paenibacillus phyllosphaerae TaxID=274593 RepID=A0A7W5AZJ0_9BACL|nr:response regulator [Paenibacillus phyllosphaerae]MBB3111667.1 two-component system response regulator YesN [Paenibacillus phyllosphaerae]